MKRLFWSLFITALVSAAVGLSAYFFKVTFWGTFIAAFLIQIIFFYFWTGYRDTKFAFHVEEIENQRIAELAKQAAVINCSGCRHQNIAFIRLDKENRFTCEACQKINSVYISIEAAQVTTPITPEHAAASEEIVKELADKAIKAVTNESTNSTTASTNTK